MLNWLKYERKVWNYKQHHLFINTFLCLILWWMLKQRTIANPREKIFFRQFSSQGYVNTFTINSHLFTRSYCCHCHALVISEIIKSQQYPTRGKMLYLRIWQYGSNKNEWVYCMFFPLSRSSLCLFRVGFSHVLLLFPFYYIISIIFIIIIRIMRQISVRIWGVIRSTFYSN